MRAEQERPEGAPLTIEDVARIAREVALRDGYHLPTLIAEGDSGPTIAQFPELPPTHEMRAEMMYVAGRAMAKGQMLRVLRQVFFIAEGWMSAPAAGEDDVAPSQHPERKEVLIVSGLTVPDGETQICIYEMWRDATGELTDLAPFESGEPPAGERAQSPLLEAFVAGFISAAGRGRWN